MNNVRCLYRQDSLSKMLRFTSTSLIRMKKYMFKFFFNLNIFSTNILDVLVGAAAHSGHRVLIKCDIGGKTVERSYQNVNPFTLIGFLHRNKV
jgi:hypothetical protein